jgi:serralysin
MAGRDDLRGGDGSDTYFADVFDEMVRETNTSLATGGDDLVNYSGSSGTFTLGLNLERLTLAHATANTSGTGNGLVNTITGNAGRNILDGGLLKDTLRGLNGSDTYLVDASKDTVIEASGSAAGTTDLVKFTGTAAQTYFLATNVEHLTLMGSATTRGTGNSLANTITGNNAANVLSGGSGNDTLSGMRGHDTLKGGAGRDSFVFKSTPTTANSDKIVDFRVVDDIIKLENTIFKAIGASVSRTEFIRNTGGEAVDGNDFLIYETDTGELYYDRNGDDAGGSVLVATLSKNLALTAGDFGMI